MILFFSFISWFACSTNDLQFDFDASQSNEESTAEPTEEATTEATQEITFYGDIQPVLNRACIHCHTETGRSFSMVNADLVVLFADIIARDAREGGKPPFIGDPSCRDYHGSELFLTEEEIEMFARWVETGKQIGDESNSSDPAPIDSIAPYDAEIVLPQGIDMPDWEDNLCMVYELGNSSDLRINAMTFQTDDINVVHHALLYLVPNDWNGPSDPFSCSWSGEREWKAIAAWRPGAPPIQFKGENGLLLPPNARLMSQVYLINETQEPQQFQSQALWGLNFGQGGGITYQVQRVEVQDYVIPKDDMAYQEISEQTWGYPDANIIGVLLRSDILNQGQWFRSQGSQEQCIGETGGNDGLNPMTYIFHEPISISAGSSLEIGCQWNNSQSNPKMPSPDVYDVASGYTETGSLCSAELIVEWK